MQNLHFGGAGYHKYLTRRPDGNSKKDRRAYRKIGALGQDHDSADAEKGSDLPREREAQWEMDSISSNINTAALTAIQSCCVFYAQMRRFQTPCLLHSFG